jgi:hypothetical protein
MDQEPLAILDFIQQLSEQPPEVAGMLVNAVPSAPHSPHIVTLLRVLAQQQSGALARQALDQLARMRSPAAIHALTVLSRVLPPSDATAAERGMRKLRFSGVSLEQHAAAVPFTGTDLDWRVLLSPVDPQGTQFAWFIGERQSGRALFLTLLLNDPQGILSAAIALDIPPERIPRRGPVGSLLNIDPNGGAAPVLVLLEAPFEEGARVVQSALERNWESAVVPPVAFQLLNPFIFEAEPFQAVEAVELPTTNGRLVAELTQSPLTAVWFGPERTALASGAKLERVFTSAVCASYVRRLRTMARWLKMAGEVDGAIQADALARQFLEVPPRESPFIERLCEPQSGSRE